ncbi:type IV-A pilus assembly ATPase PilB, partial [Pseudomonas syringae pv. tagetis]
HQSVTDIQFSTGLNNEAILVEDYKLTTAIDRFFDSDSGLGNLEDVDLGVDIEPADGKETSLAKQNDADDAPVVRFVNKMLLDA